MRFRTECGLFICEMIDKMKYFRILYVALAAMFMTGCDDTKDPVENVESRFARRVCVMEFTGTWCSQCPAGAATLNYLVDRAYKDQAFALAFHNEDEYTIPAERELSSLFSLGGYPSYLTDMRDSGLLNEGTCGLSIDKSLYDVPVHCGAAVSSECDAQGNVKVTARIFSERTEEYRIAAYVIEDNIEGKQLLGTGATQEDYNHRHVVRKMLTSTVKGDSVGIIAAEQEGGRTFTFKVEEGWKLDDLSVAVLAINSEGHVDNMAICAADGGCMDYEYVNN